MLEEHRKTTTEFVERINQGEKICTEAVEYLSVTWELILDDEVMENIKEDAQQAELNIIPVKEDMKKLPIKENVSKVTELK